MAKWSDIAEQAADLTAAVEIRFAANLHHVLATLRRDGSPRVSGTEVYFHAGDVWMGAMPYSGKVNDLTRDPRCALHTAPIDLKLEEGDATIDGRVERSDDLDVWAAITKQERAEVTEMNGVLLRLDVERVRLVQVVEGTSLIVHAWDPVAGVTRIDAS